MTYVENIQARIKKEKDFLASGKGSERIKDCFQDAQQLNEIRLFNYDRGFSDALKEFEEIVDNIFYLDGFQFPVVNVDKVIELKQKISTLNSRQTKSLKQKPIGEVTPSVSINQGLENKTADTNNKKRRKNE